MIQLGGQSVLFLHVGQNFQSGQIPGYFKLLLPVGNDLLSGGRAKEHV